MHVASSKRHGVRLIIGGAPDTPHTISGLRGYFRPDVPTPVGKPGDVIEDLDEAKKAVEARKDALELVEISAGEVAAAEAQVEADLDAGQKGLIAARADGRAADDTSRFTDERNAVKKEND
jgi:hypothetical protein